MFRRYICGALIVAVGALLAGWRLLAISCLAEAAPVARGKPAAPALQFQGVASCTSVGCHHGNGPLGEKGSEYTTWITHDAHARAYHVLFEERSRLIERNLRRLKPGEEPHAERDTLCLQCHVHPDVSTVAQQPRFSVLDGVGCESCHGAAEKWLGPHRTWKALGPEERRQRYREHGMTWLSDLRERAEVCAGCHIGTARADVNHDLIAAGHPRLRFELGAYLTLMPRHWSEQEERARYPDLEARAWLIGQAVSARTALELLTARAGASNRPWPEFAEYDCFACHHDLRSPSPRQQRGTAGRVPGRLPWSGWYYALLPRALALGDAERQAKIIGVLEDVEREMQKPLPEAKQVAEDARAAAGLLQAWLTGKERTRLDPDALQRLLATLKDDKGLADRGWDTGVQRYLAMTALHRTVAPAQPAAPNRQFRGYLRELAHSLRFPPGSDSPGDGPSR